MFSWLRKFFSCKDKLEVTPPEVKEVVEVKEVKVKERPTSKIEVKPEVVEEVAVSDKSFKDFMYAVGLRESSDNYFAKNPYGYLGRYQFGLARLTDLGLCSRKRGTTGYGNKSFSWHPPFSEKAFLMNRQIQDLCFMEHVRSHNLSVIRRYGMYIDQKIHGIKVTKSGIIACFHLLGEGGFINFLDNKYASDANGTKAEDYITLFEGYDIPDDLPVLNIKELKSLVEKDRLA